MRPQFLLIGLALFGCGARSVPNAAGNYYSFVEERSSEAEHFSQHDSPWAVIKLRSDHSVEMKVVMAEHPFIGSWKQQGSEVTVRLADAAANPIGVFSLVGPRELRPIKGALASVPDKSSFWRMPEQWEKELLAADRNARQEYKTKK